MVSLGTNYPGQSMVHSFHFTLFNVEVSDWKWQTSPGRNIWYTRIKATVKKATNDDENDGNNCDNDDDDDDNDDDDDDNDDDDDDNDDEYEAN